MKKFIYKFQVTKEDIDLNDHVNNIKYLEWMIKAAAEHSSSLGFSYEQCLKLGGTWIAKSHIIEYKNPSFLGDFLEMQTWIENIGKIMSTRSYQIMRPSDGKLILVGKTEWVFVDSKRMRPARIPQEIIEGFG